MVDLIQFRFFNQNFTLLAELTADELFMASMAKDLMAIRSKTKKVEIKRTIFRVITDANLEQSP